MAHLTLAGTCTHTHSCTHTHAHTYVHTCARTLLTRTGADLHSGNTKGHSCCVSPRAATTRHHRLGASTQTFLLTALETEACGQCQRGGKGPRSGHMAKGLWVPPIRALIPFMGPTLMTSPPPKGLPQHLHLGLGLQRVGGGHKHRP